MSLLDVRDVSVRYGLAQAVTEVSLSVPPRGAVAILGANGAGKSSFGRAICGLTPKAAGVVSLDGRDISRAPAYEISRRGLAYLPEGRGIFPGLSVQDNLRIMMLGLRRSGLSDALDRSYELFPALAKRRQLRAGSLSGGEQQMLALARILVTEPRVLIADEPSLGLAPKPIELVFECLATAQQSGVAVVLIEQYVRRALAFCSDVVILRRGRVAWQGAVRDAGAEVLDAYLGGAAQ